ncbi:hypothetical protein B6N60_04656 [Richelia sinica FACHB-800]|uniref:Uncharacterized protein n=1 Tax=Richelia sinica FACHB-800 TaxID=1357546 RepID=A0A975Y746_9NOST|nr:hypothetical protein B6N60_04656 [Richelia sinica FACHB-800]
MVDNREADGAGFELGVLVTGEAPRAGLIVTTIQRLRIPKQVYSQWRCLIKRFINLPLVSVQCQ